MYGRWDHEHDWDDEGFIGDLDVTDKIRYEIMVCDCGAFWTLRLRRPDAGSQELLARYLSEQSAIDAAHEFLRDRRLSHPAEHWFCLHPEY